MARTSSKSNSKIIKTIPNQEELKTTCFTKQNESGDKYIITRNQFKQQFTLWKCVDDGFEKISVSDNPKDFDDKIPYDKGFYED